MTGTITRLEPDGHGGGSGHIAPDAREAAGELGFRTAAVAVDGVARLRRGQRVRFDRVPLPGDPAVWHAVHVLPLAAQEPAR